MYAMSEKEGSPGAVEKSMKFLKGVDVVVGGGALASALLFPASAAVALPIVLWSGVSYGVEHLVQKGAETWRTKGTVFSRKGLSGKQGSIRL